MNNTNTQKKNLRAARNLLRENAAEASDLCTVSRTGGACEWSVEGVLEYLTYDAVDALYAIVDGAVRITAEDDCGYTIILCNL